MIDVMRSHLIGSLFMVDLFQKASRRNRQSNQFGNSYITFRFSRYLISPVVSALFDKLFGCIIRKVRSSVEYLQAVRRGPRNCINFSNKTESYKFAAARNIVRESSVPRGY